MQLTIKETHKTTIVGFNNSGLPLGQRDDILELAIIAREANDQFLLSFFEGDVPSLEELRNEKAKKVLPPIPEIITPPAEQPSQEEEKE